jgi:hypothetical protein
MSDKECAYEYQDDEESDAPRTDPITGEVESKSNGSSHTSNKEMILQRKQRDAVNASLNLPVKQFLNTINLLCLFLILALSSSISIGFVEITSATDGKLHCSFNSKPRQTTELSALHPKIHD